MKRLLPLLLALFAITSMAQAQDIYTVGSYTNGSGNQLAAVYKNGSKYWDFFGNSSFTYEATDIAGHNNDLYWIWNAERISPSEPARAKVVKNGVVFLDEGDDNKYRFNGIDIDYDGWVATVGYKIDADHSNLRRAAKWTCNSSGNSSATANYLGNTSYNSYAYDVDWYGDYLYVCGVQYTSSSAYKGVVWKGNGTSPYLELPSGFAPQAIAVDIDGTVYTAGHYYDGSTTTARVYENTTLKWTLSTSNSRAWDIQIDDAGDIYVTGWEGSTLKVWKNGVSAYTINTGSSNSRVVVANSNGVYNAGNIGTAGKIWKNGSLLYSPSSCDYIKGMYIAEPECTNNEVRGLPFTETFENGSTSWPCWTTIDVDGSNGTDRSYWHRAGRNLNGWMTGDYGARHAAHTDVSQNGWLITPRLFLQPGQDETKMTFKSWVSSAGFDMSVKVSTNADPTNTSSYQEVFSQHQNGGSVQTYTVDLSAYQGQAVYIAFQYFGYPSTSWLIDDVSVTESFLPCTNYSAPYSFDFGTGFGSCFTALDIDMSGGEKCWKPNTSDESIYHPYGQNGVPQTGWLFSTRVNLPTGNYNYTLSFKSKSTSNGTGRRNTAWIEVDGTGAHDPSNYTTKIWEDPDYNSVWTTYTVDLTAYKGHTVSIGFKYEGTYAHNWYIDDFSITNEVSQYTITANANNNAWGTVTGGGTYNSGASCTLTATPASGYQFQSWKKNGSVVSTNPNYTFTVTENATYTAYFGALPAYTITTQANPADGGMVTGGGTYQEGSSITLTATPNPGYIFDHWNDGNTQNPRTVTVTGNATYTAYFTQNTYTINVYASPTYGGSVTGGGTFHYGETTTLTATPASGYEFAGWSDANTQNPRTVTVTGNANYTAIFNEVGATYYTVSTQANPDYAGYVTGGGTYEEGSSILLTAVAYDGYSFTQWNDGVTQNPRTVTVTGNMSFTANFAAIPYTISVTANPVSAGTVSGGGVYYYGDVAVLYAEAYSGFEFVGWSDGSNENPHSVTVTGNASYTATFSTSGATYYTVSAYVSPAGAGEVTGTGTYPEGTSVTLTAEANAGYSFSQWNDGVTANPRTVTVNNNMSFVAYFNAEQYTITVNANPAAGGSVLGGGTYAYGATAILTATPNANYTFMQWSDGNTQNPRMVTVTQNATYTALFVTEGGQMYTLTVEPSSVFLGQTFGSGVYPAGSAVEISAYPTPYSAFTQWNDGNTENPRTVIVNGDATYIAQFVSLQHYEITVVSADPTMGEAYGGGNYVEGSVIEISALAYEGYQFSQWSDGNTSNPRSVTVTGNATYTAQFVSSSVVTYTLTLICNTDEGSVSGGGVYVEGTTATIQAFPKAGYELEFWSDGSLENPRTVTMTGDLTLVAFFKWTSVDEIEQHILGVYPNPACESIRLEGLESECEVRIYNALGELVRIATASPDKEIGVQDLSSGLYVVRVGKQAFRFVKH